MSQALYPSMTAEEFLAWEREQERPWEFDGFEPRAMTGGTDAHAAICANLVTALVVRLRGSGCRARGQVLKVQIGSKIRYPDALVSCTPIPPDADIARDPVVIFEVLSKSTQRTDKTEKLMQYRSLSSVQRYVLLEQDKALATVYFRTSDGWKIDQLKATAVLAMPEIGIEIPVSEFYVDVTLPDLPDDSDVRPEER